MAIQYRIRNDENMEELVLEEVNKSDNHKKLLFEIFLIIVEITASLSIKTNALLTLFILEDFPPANITQGYLTF